MGDSAATRVLLIEDSLGDALRVTRRLAHETESRIDEAEWLQSLGVLAAGAPLGFNQLIPVVLDHTEEALTELGGIPHASRAQGGSCTICCERRATLCAA